MEIWWPSFYFLLFAALACAFALAVVFSQNIVRMALYLILSLSATSGLFFVAGADFVGAMQLMIYVGGTLVLVVFGVMLTSQAPFIRMRTSSGELLLSLLLGGALALVLGFAVWQIPEWRVGARLDAPMQTATPLGMGLLGVRVDRPNSADAAGYLLVFEIVSVHLLVVLVGAAYLARSKRRGSSLTSGGH